MAKISSLTELAVEPATDDVFAVVDTSVTTTKKIQWATIKALFPTHDLATAASDFLVASGSGAWIKKTLAQTMALLGIDPYGAPKYVMRTGIGTVTNSTTLANDSTLLFPVSANQWYGFFADLYYNSKGTTADFKCGWSVPAGATMYWNNSNASETLTDVPSVVLTEGSVAARPGANYYTRANFSGIINMGTTPGTVYLQWAQNTAGTTNLLLSVGSNICYWRGG